MEIKLTTVRYLIQKRLLLLIMRTFIFLLCTTVFSLNPESSLAQVKVKIDTDKKVTVEDVFDIIKTQTDYRFIYPQDLFKDAPKIQLKKGEITVSKLLEKSLSTKEFNVVLSTNNKIIIEAKKPLQQLTITGKVKDVNGLPLPGITVYVTNIEPAGDRINTDFIVRGTATDIDGNYKLIGEVGYFLVASGLGYEFNSVEVTADRTEYNFTLKEKASALEEVLVVGYGTTKKKDLTGSVGSVNSEDIQQIKTQTIDQALTGKVAGVYVQNRGGQPGAGAFVQIRGLSQIRGDNQPLYVIDGVPITITPNSESLGLINYGNRENPLLAINPDDIERVDILKDASAAAIYGSRAANGVIIVTTKRGKRGQAPRFSFNASSTIQNPVDTYDYLSASQYIDWAKANAQGVLDQYPPAYWPIYFPQEYAMVNDPDSFFGTANTDWQDLITNKNALWTQYSFSVSGGSEKVNYFTSFGVSDQDGVLIDNNFKRYNFSTNIDASITDYFKVGTSINYNYSINKNKGFTSLAQGAFRPDLPAYNPDGTYPTYEGNYGEQYTALGNGKQIRNKAISKNLLGTVYGEVKILDGLKFRSQINISLNEDRTDNFSTSKSENALVYGLYYAQPGARLGVQTNNSWSTTFTNTLNYNKSFGDHTIDAVLGISWDHNRYDAESQSYRGFPDDNILTNINSASFFDSAESEHLQQGLNSLFGRINYNYQDKYLATFTARRDGSTKFGPDNRYGFFPSGALAWNMHNEEFLKDNATINQLKLRASMGRVGSDNLPSFTYLAYYQSLENNDSFYDGQNGIAVTGVPNTGIRWEATDQLDLGVEFGLFNSRLNGEIVYYEKNTSGIILFSPIPSETGALSWNTNIADVSNKGWEFTIGGDIFRTDNFTWNSSVNFATVKNNVDHLYGANANQSGIVEGQPIGVIVGYDVIKIAQTQQEIDDLNAAAGGVYQSSLVQPGDYIFKDITGDGVVTTADRGPIGNPNPDFFGGWNNQLTYKSWNFTMNWNFVQGAERAYGPITDLYYVDVNSNITSLALDTWSVDNTDASYARHGSATNGYTATSRSVVDASYIKLRSASVGYNLPKKWFGNLGVTNAKLTLSGNNLITITNYPGLDPEDVSSFGFANRTTNFNNDDGRSYPNTRSFTFSVNITF